jgi:hypothetical protein
MEGRELFSPII